MSEIIQKPVKIRSGDTILFNPPEIKTKDVTLIRSGGIKKLSIFNAIFNSYYSDFHLLDKNQRENVIKQNIVEIFKLDKKFWIKKLNPDFKLMTLSIFKNINNFLSDSPIENSIDEKSIVKLITSEKMVKVFFKIVNIDSIINNIEDSSILILKKSYLNNVKIQLDNCKELSLLDSKTNSTGVKHDILLFVEQVLNEVENICYYQYIKKYFRSLEKCTDVETISKFTNCNIVILDPINLLPSKEQSFFNQNIPTTILLYKHENQERYDNIYEIIPDRIIRDFKTDSLFIQNISKFISKV